MTRTKGTYRHIIRSSLFVLVALGVVACGASPQPAPTLSPQGPELKLAAQVASVSPATRTITIPPTAQGLTTIAVANSASISDFSGKFVSLEEIRPGMLIEVTGQATTTGPVLATEIRIMTPSAAPTLATEAGLAEDAIKKFISALAIDPSGNTAMKYLSRGLQAQAQSGTPIPLLAGIRYPVPSFNLSVMEPATDPTRINFRVTLNYPNPVDRILMLVKEDGVWRVDRIVTA